MLFRSVRNRLAGIDTTTGTATSFDPNMGSTVNALAISGTTLYAGGSFLSVNGGTVRSELAAIDTTTGTATSFDPNMNNLVSALAISGTTLYAGGAFTSVNGGSKLTQGVSVINLNTGQPLP